MVSDSPSSHLAPGYLVAAPALRDPNFSGSLVLMAGHRQEGAMGFVVNRPAPVSAPELLENVDASLAALARRPRGREVPVLVGGPVAGDQLWILHRRSPDLPDDGDGVRVGRALSLGSSLPLLEALLRAEDPGPFLLLVGYAGWAPMQLENEIAHGAWIPMEFAEDLAFDVPVASRWEEAVRRLGLDPAGFAVGGGGAMA
jgi:putative transcriptional regulator